MALWTRISRERHHEVQIASEGAADLQKTLCLCSKHPGHREFIPITDFNEDHLPSCYRDPDVVDFIRAQANITVRVSSKSNIVRTGSGWVYDVEKYAEGDNRFCECEKCRGSDNPQRIAGKVGIKTAAHVVSNTSDVKNVMIHFFYDTAETNLDTVPTLSGLELVFTEINGDWFKMSCETHDVDLIDRLYNEWQNFQKLHKKVYDKFHSGVFDSCTSDPKPNLTIIVSHPHGCKKYVSLGNWVDRQETKDDRELTQYVYTNPTCPGCSGALVNMLGRSSSQCYHPHYGATEIPGLNGSGVGLDKNSNSSQLLDDFHTGMTPTLSLKDLEQHVVEFSEDQDGSKFVLQQLEHATEEEKRMVFEEIRDKYCLMVHEYGHPIFVKFFEIGSLVQKEELAAKVTSSFLRLACYEHGIKVVTKALEFLTPDERALLVKKLEGEVIEYLKDEYGNQMVQKCFEYVDLNHLQFIIDALSGQMFDLSTDQYGSLFVKYVLMRARGIQTTALLEEFCVQIIPLAENLYGSEIIKDILKGFSTEQKSPVLDKLRSHHHRLAVHQYGSDVIQCMLEHCTMEQRNLSLEEFRGHMVHLALDRYGSNVIRCIVKCGTEEQVALVIQELLEHTLDLAQNKHGKNVIQCLRDHGYSPP